VHCGQLIGIDDVIRIMFETLSPGLSDLPFSSRSIRPRVPADRPVGQKKARDRNFPATGNLISRLLNAALMGDIAELKHLLKTGQALDVCDPSGNTVLTHLLSQRDREPDSGVVELLINAGVPLNTMNKYGDTAFQIALRHGLESIIHVLSEAGAINPKQFQKAIKTGDLKTVDSLLRQGANPLMNTPSFPAALLAAQHGQGAVLERFSAHGLDLHGYRYSGMGLLCSAAKAQKTDALTYLLNEGLDVDAACNKRGDTPLFFAIMSGRKKNAAVLVESGAKVNVRNAEGVTPLLLAVSRDQAQTVRLLIQHKADTDIRDSEGNTAFDLAMKQEAFHSAAILRPQSEEEMLLHCRGTRLRLKSNTGRWKQFSHAIEENLERLSKGKNPDGYYEIWSHHIDMVPAAFVKIFEESIGICQTGGGPGWKKLLAFIERWRQIFDNGLVLEKIQGPHQDGQGTMGSKTTDTACIHERMMPLEKRPGFKAVQWLGDTSWCPDCGVLIRGFYDWHDGISSVTYLPPSANVLFNRHSNFTDVLAYLDSVDTSTYSKIIGLAKTYFRKAEYDHSSAWDTIIHRLESTEASKPEDFLIILRNILISADTHFEGYVAEVPLHPHGLSPKERAEFYRKAYEEIETNKASFAERPEEAAISLKTVTPVAKILAADGKGEQGDTNATESYGRKSALEVLTKIYKMDKRQLVFMPPSLRQNINRILDK